ncbi:MAG: hypothetical protein GY940_15200 [bacterium]|nr:hypothetical protein [bacterium]
MIKKTTYALALSLLILPLFHCSSGVILSFTNNSGQTLRDLEIFYTGGSVSVEKSVPGSTETFKVNPTSESHIEIQFKDQNNKTYKGNVGVYFESGYSGTLDMEIDSFREIKWRDNIKITGFFSSCNEKENRNNAPTVTAPLTPID